MPLLVACCKTEAVEEQCCSMHELDGSGVSRSVSIILVEPKFSKNIGSVARAMGNFGFNDLRLVKPRDFDLLAAQVTACWASDILEAVQVYPDLHSAVSDLVDVIGFSSSYGKNRTAHCTLQEFVARSGTTCTTGKRGLVFGPEDTGLRNEHVSICRTLVRIPSNAHNPSFNLSQAVLLALYEIMRQDSDREVCTDELPSWEDYHYLEKLIGSILTASEFQTRHTSPGAIRVLHSLFKRMQANKREMSMILGLFSKIEQSLLKE